MSKIDMVTQRMATILIPLVLSTFLVLPAGAQDQENPYLESDRSWISLSGTVESVDTDEFLLDYGDGVITVEMDDGDRDADAAVLATGDEVTVSGRVDDDFLETATIEAASVYVQNLGTTFYASAVDEEDAMLMVTPPVVVGQVTLRGWVTGVTGQEFTLDTGVRQITVTVEEMPYDPLDDEGYQRVEIGDNATVFGHIDRDLFEGRVVAAESIVEHFD